MSILFVLVGLLGGVLGSMGLGGGTILIPLLLLFNLSQKQAQLINILAFVITSVLVVFFHVKNKLIDVFPAVFFSVCCIPFCVFGAIMAKNISENTLKILFGIFMIILATIQFFVYVLQKKAKKQ